MNRLKNILACTDFSENSRSALAQALRLAHPNAAAVYVLHVVDPQDTHTLPESCRRTGPLTKEGLVQAATRALENWLRTLADTERVQPIVDVGPAIDRFLHHQRRTSSDLAVLGAHGRNHPNEQEVGILATKVLRKSPCKVLLVAGALEQRFSRIVACIDFSETSVEVAQQAFRMAGLEQAGVHFVHVLSTFAQCQAYDLPVEERSQDELACLRAELLEKLRAFAPDATTPCACEVLVSSSPGDALAEFAREVKADLLILGTKGRTNLSYVLLGSTAERLMRQLPCSALVVKPPPEESVS
jgi:universal stress protein E